MSGTPSEGPGVRTESLEVRRTARVLLHGPETAAEAWLLLHGYGQLASQLLGQIAGMVEPGRLLVAPEALSRFYRARQPDRVGASWMTREAREAEIHDYLRYLDEVAVRWLHPAGSARRVAIQAFSQGTATATRWAAHTAVPIHRLVLWGGGVAPDIDLAETRRRQPAMHWHLCIGRGDDLIPASAVDTETARLAAAGVPFTLHWFDGGHEVNAELLRTLAQLDGPAA